MDGLEILEELEKLEGLKVETQYLASLQCGLLLQLLVDAIDIA